MHAFQNLEDALFELTGVTRPVGGHQLMIALQGMAREREEGMATWGKGGGTPASMIKTKALNAFAHGS